MLMRSMRHERAALRCARSAWHKCFVYSAAASQWGGSASRTAAAKQKVMQFIMSKSTLLQAV